MKLFNGFFIWVLFHSYVVTGVAAVDRNLRLFSNVADLHVANRSFVIHPLRDLRLSQVGGSVELSGCDATIRALGTDPVIFRAYEAVTIRYYQGYLSEGLEPQFFLTLVPDANSPINQVVFELRGDRRLMTFGELNDALGSRFEILLN